MCLRSDSINYNFTGLKIRDILCRGLRGDSLCAKVNRISPKYFDLSAISSQIQRTRWPIRNFSITLARLCRVSSPHTRWCTTICVTVKNWRVYYDLDISAALSKSVGLQGIQPPYPSVPSSSVIQFAAFHFLLLRESLSRVLMGQWKKCGRSIEGGFSRNTVTRS